MSLTVELVPNRLFVIKSMNINYKTEVNLPVPPQARLPGSPPYGGVQSEAGAGVQCLRHSDRAHRALQGRPLFTQAHQGKSQFLLVYSLLLQRWDRTVLSTKESFNFLDKLGRCRYCWHLKIDIWDSYMFIN